MEWRTCGTDSPIVRAVRNPAYGYRAAWKVLQSYYTRYCHQSKPFTVRNIITQWAPPNENDTESYIRNVLTLSGIGGRENLLPPGNALGFNRLSRLLAGMTCVECGVAYGQVDKAAICEGYKLAFPENVEELEEILLEEDEYSGW